MTPGGVLKLALDDSLRRAAQASSSRSFLERIEQRYGRANRIWVMDRGIPTEENLAQMRARGASYLVDTPKGRLTRLEQAFLAKPYVPQTLVFEVAAR